MPKESLILNNFSGGINSNSSPRDIESNKSSTEARIEGYNEKGGQLSDLKNAEVDKAGVIRVSGGESSTDIISDLNLSSLVEYVNNSNIFSSPIDSKFAFFSNDDFVFDGSQWIIDSGNSTHEFSKSPSITPSNQVDTNDFILESITDSPNSGSILKASISDIHNDHDADAYESGNLGYIHRKNITLKPGQEYTIKTRIKTSKPWPVHGASYPPWLEIWNDDIEKTKGSGTYGICYTPIRGCIEGQSSDVYKNVGVRMSKNTTDGSSANIANHMAASDKGSDSTGWTMSGNSNAAILNADTLTEGLGYPDHFCTSIQNQINNSGSAYSQSTSGDIVPSWALSYKIADDLSSSNTVYVKSNFYDREGETGSSDGTTSLSNYDYAVKGTWLVDGIGFNGSNLSQTMNPTEHSLLWGIRRFNGSDNLGLDILGNSNLTFTGSDDGHFNIALKDTFQERIKPYDKTWDSLNLSYNNIFNPNFCYIKKGSEENTFFVHVSKDSNISKGDRIILKAQDSNAAWDSDLRGRYYVHNVEESSFDWLANTVDTKRITLINNQVTNSYTNIPETTGLDSQCYVLRWRGLAGTQLNSINQSNFYMSNTKRFSPISYFTNTNSATKFQFEFAHSHNGDTTSSSDNIHVYLDNMEAFKAGIDFSFLYSVDEDNPNINPSNIYTNDTVDGWANFEYTFTVPESCDESDKWEIKLNLGCVSGSELNSNNNGIYDPGSGQNDSVTREFSMLIDNIQLLGNEDTSEESNNLIIFNTQDLSSADGSSSYLKGIQGSVIKTLSESSSQNERLTYYNASGRIFLSDTNFNNTTSPKVIDTSFPTEKNRNIYSPSKPSDIKVYNWNGANGMIELDKVESQTGGIDYNNILKIVDGGTMLSSNTFARTLYARINRISSDFTGPNSTHDDNGEYHYFSDTYNAGNEAAEKSYHVNNSSTNLGRYAQAISNNETNGHDGGNTSNIYKHNNVNLGECVDSNRENWLIMQNHNNERLSWAASCTYGFVNRKREHLVVCDNTLFESTLQNDIAKIEYEIINFTAGYKFAERFTATDHDGRGCGNYPVYHDITFYKQDSANSLPNEHSLSSVWFDSTFRELKNLEEMYTKRTNPQNKTWNQLVTVTNDCSAYFTVSDANKYDYAKAIYSGVANFGFGDWPKSEGFAFQQFVDNSVMLDNVNVHGDNANTATNHLIRNGDGALHKGVHSYRIEKLWVYGYTASTAALTTPSNNDFSSCMIKTSFSGEEGNGWDSEFEWAITSVNHHEEESPLSDNKIVSAGSSGSNASLNFHFYVKKNIIEKTDIHKIKIYAKRATSDIFYLQAEIDTLRNEYGSIKSSTAGVWRTGNYQNTHDFVYYELPLEDCTTPNQVDSFESQTLINPLYTEPNNYYPRFKSAIVANNRVYAGNLMYGTDKYPDRMVKSPLGKYGQLPIQNFIDVAINDGDEIVHLEYYKDYILQFKNKKVFVINISEDYEYLENTFEGVGVINSKCVCKTPGGIAWINSKGCYFYDGSDFIDLTKDKLSKDNFIGSHAKWDISDNKDNPSSIGYLKKENKLIIFKNTNKDLSSDELGEGYLFDINSTSWSMFYGRYDISSVKSNFIYDENENLGWINYISNDFGSIKKWSNEPTSTPTSDNSGKEFKIITKDFVFDDPARRKKIYKVYVTYKSTLDGSSSNSNVKIYYAKNGKATLSSAGATDNWTAFDESASVNYGSNGLAGTASWERAELKFTNSSDVNNIYSLQLKFELNQNSSKNVPDGFMINDIEIIYRGKNVR